MHQVGIGHDTDHRPNEGRIRTNRGDVFRSARICPILQLVGMLSVTSLLAPHNGVPLNRLQLEAAGR